MAEYDNRREMNCMTNTLITWAVVMVTATVTFLCVRFSVGMTTNLDPSSGPIYRTSDDKPEALENSKVLVITTPSIEITSVNFPKTGLDPTSALARKQELNNRSVIEFLPTATNETLMNRDTDGNDRFVVRPSMYENTTLSFVVSGDLTNTNLNLTNRHNDNDVENDESEVNINTRLYGTKKRKIKQRQINHNDNSNIDMDKFMTKEDARTSYQKSYDSIYNEDHNGYNENENPIYGPEPSTVDRPEQTYSKPILSETSNWERPVYGVTELPSVHPPRSIIKHNDHFINSKKYPIDWRKIVLLALIKFGLFKLQANNFLNILLLLVFKFKLIVTAFFFKFLFILKLMKVFVSMIFPLSFLPLMPKLMQFISILLKILYTVWNSNTIQPVQNIWNTLMMEYQQSTIPAIVQQSEQYEYITSSTLRPYNYLYNLYYRPTFSPMLPLGADL